MPAAGSCGLELLRRLLATPPACNDGLLTTPSSCTCTTSAAALSSTCCVPVEPADSLSYGDFVERYMAPNLPVLVKGACKGWRAMADWTAADGSINMQQLQQVAGHCRVAVTDTSRHHNGCGPCSTMTLDQYCSWWDQHHKQQQQQQQGRQQQQDGQQQQQQQQSADSKAALYYLKDWHFVGEFPDAQVYSLPMYFQEDWLNEFYDAKQQQTLDKQQQQRTLDKQQQQQTLDKQQQQQTLDKDKQQQTLDKQQQQQTLNKQQQQTLDKQQQQQTLDKDKQHSEGSSVVTSDYRFVYCGPAGSWTPVHSDVLRSYSWSANVVGRKRWWLLPPQHSRLLRDRYGQLPTDFFQAAEVLAHGEGLQQQQQQQQQQQFGSSVHQHLLEVVQDVGDVLFVPSGWHHMVLNELDTLSINHNWLNAHNVHWSWALLRSEHQQATEQLEDCRDTASPEEFEGLVQNMLAANSGFNFEDFAAFLSIIISRRLQTVQQLQLEEMTAEVAEAPPAAALPVLVNAADSSRHQQQLLHCALDLSRASAVLDQVQQAYVAALAHNHTWLQKHCASSKRVAAHQVPSEVASSQCSGEQQLVAAWVQEAQSLAEMAQAVVARIAV